MNFAVGIFFAEIDGDVCGAPKFSGSVRGNLPHANF
jgi:hypothetical protein